RRTLRGVGGQAHFPRVRRRGTRALRTARARVPCARRAAAEPQGEAAPYDEHAGEGDDGPPRGAAARGRDAGRRRGRREPEARVIDLHLHTTASDGRSTPADLVAEAKAAGCRTIAVTDHDTVAGLAEAAAAAAAAGLTFIPGIEVTAVADGRDIHILGYFFDPSDRSLDEFLTIQRERRRERIAGIAERLRRAGVVIDADRLLADYSGAGRSIGRPAVAQALIAGGYATDVSDAFECYLVE